VFWCLRDISYTHRGVIALPTFEIGYDIAEWVETGIKEKSNSSIQQQ